MIREEQDSEFHEALKADQERERAEEEARRKAAEEEAARAAEESRAAEAIARAEAAEAARIEARRRKADALPPEPEPGTDVSRVVVRMPDGQRLDRRWHKDTPIQTLVDWVESVDAEAGPLSLESHFPRVTYGAEDLTTSLHAAGLHPQATLYVREAESGEECGAEEEGDGDAGEGQDAS